MPKYIKHRMLKERQVSIQKCKTTPFPPTVTWQLRRVYLKIRTVPPSAMTINALCWQHLHRPSIQPSSERLISNINHQYYAVKKNLSMHCNWSTISLDFGRRQNAHIRYYCRQQIPTLSLLCFLLAIAFDENRAKKF